MPRAKKTATGEATTTATANPKPEVSTPKGQKVPKSEKKLKSAPQIVENQKKVAPMPETLPSGRKPKSKPAAKPAKPADEVKPKPALKPGEKRGREKATTKPGTIMEATSAETPEPKSFKTAQPAKSPAPAGKFPEYIRRDVAGEKVAVKKFEPYGMAVIHGPDGKLSNIFLSAWDKDGNLLQYRQPAGAARVQGVEAELAKIETRIAKGKEVSENAQVLLRE